LGSKNLTFFGGVTLHAWSAWCRFCEAGADAGVCLAKCQQEEGGLFGSGLSEGGPRMMGRGGSQTFKAAKRWEKIKVFLLNMHAYINSFLPITIMTKEVCL